MPSHPRARIFLALLGGLLAIAPPASASAGVHSRTAGPQIGHDPIRYFVGGRRIRLAAEVENGADVTEVRCYFRAMGRGDFVFAQMEPAEKGGYTVLLPAPVATTTAIQYRIEARGRRGVLAKTKTFFVERRDSDEVPAWQDIATDEALRAGESGGAGAPEGFSDGRTAGESPGSPDAAARTAGAAEGGAGGGAAAATGGISTTALVGAGVGAALVGGGVAYAVSQGGDGDSAVPCNQSVHAGGDDPEDHEVSLGRTSGTFGFGWDMQNVPDRMRLVYQGSTIFDTGCVSGTGFRNVSYGGSSKTVRVVVTPNCSGPTSGTYWQFQVSCPQ